MRRVRAAEPPRDIHIEPAGGVDVGGGSGLLVHEGQQA